MVVHYTEHFEWVIGRLIYSTVYFYNNGVADNSKPYLFEFWWSDDETTVIH